MIMMWCNLDACSLVFNIITNKLYVKTAHLKDPNMENIFACKWHTVELHIRIHKKRVPIFHAKVIYKVFFLLYACVCRKISFFTLSYRAYAFEAFFQLKK